MRQRQVNAASLEDIISYECNYPGKFIRVLIGIGNDDGLGNFVVLPEQNYEVITLYEKEFDELMAPVGNKPANVFRKEDLWTFIDTLRPVIAQEKLNGRIR